MRTSSVAGWSALVAYIAAVLAIGALVARGWDAPADAIDSVCDAAADATFGLTGFYC